jgi:hypothetical protein
VFPWPGGWFSIILKAKLGYNCLLKGIVIFSIMCSINKIDQNAGLHIQTDALGTEFVAVVICVASFPWMVFCLN